MEVPTSIPGMEDWGRERGRCEDEENDGKDGKQNGRGERKSIV